MSTPKRSGGLGRGLGTLIQNTEFTPSQKQQRPVDGLIDSTQSRRRAPEGSFFAEIPVADIRANPKNPRTDFDEDELAELTESIKEVGLLQPIVVRPLGREDGVDKYELVMGERRWRATRAAGLAQVPTIVRRTEDADLLRDALLENIHRAQLNPLEEAYAYQQLMEEFDCTQEELSVRIKRSRPQISNTVRLLRLPPSVQRRVAAGVLSAGHAKALLGLEGQLAQERLAQRIVAEGLSVRATEEVVTLGAKEDQQAHKTASGPREKSPRAVELTEKLSDWLETRAKVDIGKNKGRITIEFASTEDLDRILEVMKFQS